MSRTKNKFLSKILSWILTVVITLLVIFSVYAVICNARQQPAFVGNYSFSRIITESMEPLIPADSLILIKRVNKKNVDDLKVGDIIMFRSHDPQIDGKLNTHRIVEIIKEGGVTKYITKGDNNLKNDDLTTVQGDVIAKYQKNLTAITRIFKFFQNKTVFLIVIIIPAFLLLIFCFLDVKKKAKQAKTDLLVQEKLNELRNSQNPDLSIDDNKKE